MRLACPSGKVRFNGAELAFDGCSSSTQSLEATSRDLGCDADLFEGEEAGVSLFGELSVAAGSTLELRDEFNNAPGKSAEAVYARGLTVGPGATLVTNGLRIYARNASILGSIDDPANLCIVPDLPDPDINGDGFVNAIDVAYVLTYWDTPTAVADLDRSGMVDAGDLAIILNGWTG